MRDAGLEGGRLILVSSMVGFCGLVGYSQYAPMKHAIRGLAEVLRSEFQLYGIAVQCYFPAGILSPGFEQEEKTKPACLREIEKSDKPQSPQACAKALIGGVERGQFFITSDFQTDLFRAANSGVQPGNGWLLDRLKASLASVRTSLGRRDDENWTGTGDAHKRTRSDRITNMAILRSGRYRQEAPPERAARLQGKLEHIMTVAQLAQNKHWCSRYFRTSGRRNGVANRVYSSCCGLIS